MFYCFLKVLNVLISRILALNKNQIWAIIIAGLFIILNAIAIYLENFFVSALPIILLIVVLAFLALDKLLLAVVFMVPLSVPLKIFVPNLEIGMSLPTEPILFGILLVFIFKIIYEKNVDKRVLYHPVSLAIYFSLAWMLVTTISSTLPVVSIKYLIARIWFIVAFYFLATQLFRDEKNIQRFLWLYIAGFIIVIIYTLTRHLGYGLFNQKASHWVVYPFFKDHTSYGAMLSMFIPILIGFGFFKKYSLNRKLIIWFITSLFIFALVFSYTRAAWVSVFGAVVIWVIIQLKIPFKWLFGFGVIVLIVLFLFRTQIMLQLEQNRQDSSEDFKEHIQSISNVSSDASNLERINRWASAIRMFREKPFLGWGPGTYMFQYAPFQMSYQRTIISTNAADLGNAHSEYIGPLSESGIFGMLSVLFIVGLTAYTAIILYFKLKDKHLKIIVLSTFIGLVTYYLHGFLNNFLDTDKASAPVWGFTAIIVAIDIYHRNKEKEISDSAT